MPSPEAPPTPNVYSEDVTRILSGYNSSGEQISQLVRYIGFGLVGLYVATLSSTSEAINSIMCEYMILLQISAVCGAAAIFLEYLNFVFSRRAHAKILRMIDTNDSRLLKSGDNQHFLFDKKEPAYFLSQKAFQTKQIAAGIGCGAVLLIFLQKMFSQ